MDFISLTIEWMQRHRTYARICSALIIGAGAYAILSLHSITWRIFVGIVCGVYFLSRGTLFDACACAWSLTLIWRISSNAHEHWPNWRDQVDPQILPLTIGGVLLVLGAKGFELVNPN
ncbi:uncharacterized protein RCC_08469 [Ramularia collo-cygni]|uniref:Uncharacterized protein n=1 Tax=Ramularia collo-cygni TaxID=112498 RepID=A0A2D3VKA7_9PEZI|nr:uncharacterized protein RCC_08469 [Ramularia collo-cygni]CZT22764.1 uncharacterized protein RCC_08469 [Ramularia collo-cygni]